MELIADENHQAMEASPAKLLSDYLQTSWNIPDPAKLDIYWDTYWSGSGLMSLFCREYETKPFPMTCGWRKWSYWSRVGIIISAFYNLDGSYSSVITNSRNHIENLILDDATAMRTYGISAMRITNFSDIVDYPNRERYKDSVCDLEIEVNFIFSKTVVP